MAYVLAFALTYAMPETKRRYFGGIKILLRQDADKRERLILALYLFAFPVVVIVASVRSPWLGALVYVLVASIPLQRWLAPRV